MNKRVFNKKAKKNEQQKQVFHMLSNQKYKENVKQEKY